MGFACDRIVIHQGSSRRWLLALVLSALALSAQAQNQCSASGRMAGEKFTANHCAAALYPKSVTIWFNEDPISAQEAEEFQTSGAVDTTKNGKRRTLLLAMFCPGGGAATAAPGAVKAISLTTNHAQSLLAGIQWTMRVPKDFNVVSLSGEVRPGGTLKGKIAGKWRKTIWDLAFDVKLPAKDAATGMDCGM